MPGFRPLISKTFQPNVMFSFPSNMSRWAAKNSHISLHREFNRLVAEFFLVRQRKSSELYVSCDFGFHSFDIDVRVKRGLAWGGQHVEADPKRGQLSSVVSTKTDTPHIARILSMRDEWLVATLMLSKVYETKLELTDRTLHRLSNLSFLSKNSNLSSIQLFIAAPSTEFGITADMRAVDGIWQHQNCLTRRKADANAWKGSEDSRSTVNNSPPISGQVGLQSMEWCRGTAAKLALSTDLHWYQDDMWGEEADKGPPFKVHRSPEAAQWFAQQ